MSRAHNRVPHGKNRNNRGPHHVIIARGDKVRSFALRPGRLVAAVLATILVVSGALAAAGYFFLRDDLQVTSIAAQNDLRQQYERRIADLNRQMESLVSRNLVETSTLNEQVATLSDRQNELLQRQQMLTGLANEALAAGIDVLPMLAPIPVANPRREEVPPPTDGVGGPVDPMTTGATDTDRPQTNAGVPPEQVLAAIDATANWVDESQQDALATLADAIAERTDQLASALRSLGYSAGVAEGGPLVPIEGPVDFAAVSQDLDAFTQLQDFARTLPLGQPLTTMNVTSNFGRRVDPFVGTIAMHTGVDLAAVSGTPVHATGAGTVVIASYNGGYGNEVKIDHGNGITTIYGHMSRILVRVGDTVGTGDIIGRVGSTGRSTGPHLHYEIRRNDQPFDPMPHMRTGAQIAGLL
jgi:murein DD-endopeptidase MepM/ murein hydrolase activator NlpD